MVPVVGKFEKNEGSGNRDSSVITRRFNCDHLNLPDAIPAVPYDKPTVVQEHRL